MDITLCAGFSTDGTTLCCTHIINSSQSTLKNIHAVKTCPYDDVYYDLILACTIYVKQILSLITLMMILHGFSCTKNIQKISCSKLAISVTDHLVEVVDKLSTTAVVFFRSERILKCKHLYGA